MMVSEAMVDVSRAPELAEVRWDVGYTPCISYVPPGGKGLIHVFKKLQVEGLLRSIYCFLIFFHWALEYISALVQ